MIFTKLKFLNLLLFLLHSNLISIDVVTSELATNQQITFEDLISKDVEKHRRPVKLCKDLEAGLVKCDFNTTCVYGELNTVECRVDDVTNCKGERSFQITFPCLYCWQLPGEQYDCVKNTTCTMHTRYLTTCTANATTYCLGHREFSRYKQCNLVAGHKWSTTLVLSILFGGFGVDRFYLGHWQEGVGKLFSFGGFGVWTLVDTILISIGYLKPADSSHYE